MYHSTSTARRRRWTAGTVTVYDSIFGLAWKRTLAILIGVTMALVINRLFWPYLARKELRKRVSVTVHHITQFYSKVQALMVQGHFDPPDKQHVQQLSRTVQVRSCMFLHRAALGFFFFFRRLHTQTTQPRGCRFFAMLCGVGWRRTTWRSRASWRSMRAASRGFVGRCRRTCTTA